jgi:hypothetical protein
VAVVLNRVLFLEGRGVVVDLSLLLLVQCQKLIVCIQEVSPVSSFILIPCPIVLLEVPARVAKTQCVEVCRNEILKKVCPRLSHEGPVFSAGEEKNFPLDSQIKGRPSIGVELIGGEHNHLGHFAHLVIDQLIIRNSLDPPQVPHE